MVRIIRRWLAGGVAHRAAIRIRVVTVQPSRLFGVGVWVVRAV